MSNCGEIAERGLLIVTGSNLRAEMADRPLAYDLQQRAQEFACEEGQELLIAVISDLWYLNAEALQARPMIAVGGPGVNAVSANLYRRLPNVLVADNALAIQMDPHLQDLRAAVWGGSCCAAV